jgi:hypothetical protein
MGGYPINFRIIGQNGYVSSQPGTLEFGAARTVIVVKVSKEPFKPDWVPTAKDLRPAIELVTEAVKNAEAQMQMAEHVNLFPLTGILKQQDLPYIANSAPGVLHIFCRKSLMKVRFMQGRLRLFLSNLIENTTAEDEVYTLERSYSSGSTALTFTIGHGQVGETVHTVTVLGHMDSPSEVTLLHMRSNLKTFYIFNILGQITIREEAFVPVDPKTQFGVNDPEI